MGERSEMRDTTEKALRANSAFSRSSRAETRPIGMSYSFIVPRWQRFLLRPEGTSMRYIPYPPPDPWRPVADHVHVIEWVPNLRRGARLLSRAVLRVFYSDGSSGLFRAALINTRGRGMIVRPIGPPCSDWYWAFDLIEERVMQFYFRQYPSVCYGRSRGAW